LSTPAKDIFVRLMKNKNAAVGDPSAALSYEKR
jgi:hypothetical protein